jgi:hypothetical protein
LRISVEKEIDSLQTVETAFLSHQQSDVAVQDVFQTAVRDRMLARAALVQAEKTEADARRAYEDACVATRQRRIQLDQHVLQLSQAEHAAAVSSNELERLQTAVQHQSETVRTALCRKERAMYKKDHHHHLDSDNGAAVSSSISIMEAAKINPIVPDTAPNDALNDVRLQKLASLRHEEREMAAAAQAMEVQAAQLLSKANKIKLKVAELERES